jgi:signal transduction histidine kinase
MQFSSGAGKLTLAGAAVLSALLAFRWAPQLFSGIASSYGWAHAYCYLNNSRLIWLHVITDSAIYLSYSAISVTLAYLVYRTRREIPFSWMFLAFGTFIIACGFTHLMEVIVLWKPLYWLSGDVKLITAVASVVTAISLPPLVPRVQEMVRSASASDKHRRELELTVSMLDTRLKEVDELRSRVASANQRLQAEVERRVNTEEMLRRLSGRVLAMQDDERRRLGRELHDSAGQLLAALRINLGVLSCAPGNNPSGTSILSDTAALADQAIAEIRTLSYLLHPPMLDETGLASAVEWYVRGFSERSKIAVTLDLDPQLNRFSREMETTVFRIIQECLVNIHRHSGSTSARVSLWSTEKEIRLNISDQGRGIDPKTLELLESGLGDIGVGIRGMRERARQLGGNLEIRAASPGTTVQVTLPALRLPVAEAALSGAAG